MSYIQLDKIYKRYKAGTVTVNALNGLSLKIHKGDFIAITGKSGCGKTTLLNILGGLDSPTKGKIVFEGKNLNKYKDLSKFRSQNVGFVFQFFNLIPILTVEENICLPMIINGKRILKTGVRPSNKTARFNRKEIYATITFIRRSAAIESQSAEQLFLNQIFY